MLYIKWNPKKSPWDGVLRYAMWNRWYTQINADKIDIMKKKIRTV